MMSLRTAAAKSSRMGLGHTVSRSAIAIPSTMAKGIVGSSSVRFKSAIPTSDSSNNDAQAEAQAQGCPFTGSFTKQIPKLVEVPKLPILGSRVPQYSGTPAFAPNRMYQHAQGMYQTFGDFFSHGVPGFGQGLWGTLYNITDPVEMLKVVRSEGAYPSGGIQQMWPLAKLFQHYNSPVVGATDQELGLLGQGPGWKTQRTFFQTGMLDPRAARMYIPGISAAAELAAKGAPDAAQRGDLNYYLNLCAFDMFCTFMFGELTQCADRSPQGLANSTKTEAEREENIIFCQKAITCMEQMMALAMTPKEIMAAKVGYKTELFLDFVDGWAQVRAIGLKKLTEFAAKYEAGDLNEHERNSYFFHAMERLKDHPEISHEQMMELSFMALFAGVDTTSGVTAWNLLHVALDPEIQERLHEELVAAVQVTGGEVTDKTLEKKLVPYLHCVLKENYRLTPPVPNTATKTVSNTSEGVEVHGVTLPKGSIVSLTNKYSVASADLPDAREFKPERWTPDAVAARKGTALEEMDHAMFRDVFGQGARRCPGSRVATNELLALLAHLVLNFKIRAPAEFVSKEKTWEDVPYTLSAMLYPILPQLEFIPRQTNVVKEEEPDENVAA